MDMAGVDQLYQQVILDHAYLKHGSGEVASDKISSYQVNPTCGDEVTLTADLAADGTLSNVTWHGQGCSISQASLSMMSELVEGKTLEQVEELRENFSTMMHSRGQEVADEILDPLEDAAALQGTSKFPNRVKCALLGWMALRDVITKQQAAKEQ